MIGLSEVIPKFIGYVLEYNILVEISVIINNVAANFKMKTEVNLKKKLIVLKLLN